MKTVFVYDNNNNNTYMVTEYETNMSSNPIRFTKMQYMFALMVGAVSGIIAILFTLLNYI